MSRPTNEVDEIVDVGENDVVTGKWVDLETNQTIQSLNGLATYERAYRGEDDESPPRAPREPRIQCGLCENRQIDYENLAHHVSEDHNITTNLGQMVLAGWTDFELWKQQVSYCGEFQWRTRHSKKGIYAMVTCHRSGATEHPGSGFRPQRRRVKIGFECSCFAHAKVGNDGTVTVKFCLEHYGHEKDPWLLKTKYPQITVVMDDVDGEEKSEPRVVVRQPSTSSRRKRKADLAAIVQDDEPVVDVDPDDYVDQVDANGEIAYGEDGQMYFVIDKDSTLVEETIVTDMTAKKESSPVNVVSPPPKTRRTSRRLAKDDDEQLDVV